MRPLRVPASLAALAIAASILAGASAGGGSPARAQTPPVTIKKVKGSFIPKAADSPLLTVMVLGSDARPGEPIERLRADSIHLLTVNPDRRAGTILGFPRDSYVDIPGHGTSKINEAMVLGGPDLMAQTLESLTGIHIDYYLLTSFQGFSDMVDGIAGLVVDVPRPMHDSFSGANFSPGRQRLRGGDALAFARDRHDVPLGDIGRSENQGRLLLAALDQLHRDVRNDPAKLLKWVAIGTRSVSTDLAMADLVRLGVAATGVKSPKVTNIVVPSTVGTVGSASVVFISASAEALYADIRDNGIVGG